MVSYGGEILKGEVGGEEGGLRIEIRCKQMAQAQWSADITITQWCSSQELSTSKTPKRKTGVFNANTNLLLKLI